MMEQILEKALEMITARVNLSTGLIHPNDLNSTKDLLVKLHENNIELNEHEISLWAIEHGWLQKDAKELGKLAKKIGEGGRVQIENRGHWWKEDILDILANKM